MTPAQDFKALCISVLGDVLGNLGYSFHAVHVRPRGVVANFRKGDDMIFVGREENALHADTSETPKGKDIFYRCTECGGMVPSVPKENVGCRCGNIFIDIDYFRLAVRDYAKFEAVKKLR